MELDAKLEQLRETILNDAYRQRDQRLRELKSEKGSYIKEMQEKVLASTNQYLTQEEQTLEKEAKRELASWEFDWMKQLRKARLEIEEKVMGELKERLIAFTRSEAFAPYLRNLLERAELSVFSSGAVALCGAHAAVEEQVLREAIPDISIEKDPAIEIGGFRLKNEKRRVMIDLTLDTRLEEARHAFLSVAKLK